MKLLFYFLSAAAVIGLAYWAYEQNLMTQQALRRVRALQSDIADTREALAVQKAEWAYLNRPDRLRDLIDLNFEELQLLPMTPGHFGRIDQIPFPKAPLPEDGLSVSTSNSTVWP